MTEPTSIWYLIFKALLTPAYKRGEKLYRWVLRQVNVEKYNAQLLKTENGYLPLDRAIPYYSDINIASSETGSHYIGIPSNYFEELKELGFFRNTSQIHDTQILSVDIFQSIFTDDERDNFYKFHQSTIDEVAANLISLLKNGEPRFNGPLYGINRIQINRTPGEEKSTLALEVYNTDFFTHLVFGKLYQKFCETHSHEVSITRVQDLNKLREFSTTFGVNCFVIINKGEGDEILIAKRSESVSFDKGKWHFSMNEAFSPKHKDALENPSLTSCLEWGLFEELGLNKKYIKKYGFLEVGINTDRFETGITCFVKLKFDNDFTFSNLTDMYSIARDGELETSTFITLPIKKIDEFLQSNYENISAFCRPALKDISIRYKYGILKFD